MLDAILLLTELTERLLAEPKTKALQAEARTTLKTLEALNLLPPPTEGASETSPEPFPTETKAISNAAR